MALVYWILTVLYGIFIAITWADDVERYIKSASYCTFKEMFSLFDLGFIIFPFGWIGGFILVWLVTLFVYGDRLKQQQRGVFKPLFKKKEKDIK